MLENLQDAWKKITKNIEEVDEYLLSLQKKKKEVKEKEAKIQENHRKA